MLENWRLRELITIVRANLPFYEEFVGELRSFGYEDVSHFISEDSDEQAIGFIKSYLAEAGEASLYDGLNRAYPPSKARWYFMAWLLRDAPVQRLQPLLREAPGSSPRDRRAYVLNEIRKFIAPLMPEAEYWTWPVVAEIMLNRLEGSRRALKGVGYEVMVRGMLRELFGKHDISLRISDKQARVGDETYDIEVQGNSNSVLMPIKTRETMGGGHARLFTRDIDKSISVASENGFLCIPVVIAESWSGDLESLQAEEWIHVQANPNQIDVINELLPVELEKLIHVFRELAEAP